MYGTVAIFKVKPERVDDFLALQDEWQQTIKPKLPTGGASMAYRLDADANTFIICAAAPSKDAYFALAEDPEQDKWFGRVRETLAEDPQWNDGEVIWTDFS